jgi:hypothetical protein
MRGVQQGDIISLMIFNIIVDTVIQEWEIRVREDESIGTEGNPVFYADNGILSGHVAHDVQN